MANKITYGLESVYYAVATEGTGGALTYATPVEWEGGVSVALSAVGELAIKRADNIDYFVSASNNGYEGTLTMAQIPESFRTDVLGEVTDSSTGYVREKNDAGTTEFALMFQFDGDANATRHLFYRCVVTRPDINGQTTEATGLNSQDYVLNIKCMPRISDGYVKARCEEGATGYSSFFTAVV